VKDPGTIVVAWIVVPAIVAIASASLGLGIGRLAGTRLGALTLPAGFLTGIAIMSFGLEVGFSAAAAVVACLALALAGPLVRPSRPFRLQLRPWMLWAAGSGFAAFAIGMAPIAGSGRSAIAGYVLNNDSSVHITAIELIRDHGAKAVNVDGSSYLYVGRLFSGGYPLGSYTWPLLGSELSGVDPFHTWGPLLAVTVAMAALVVFDLVRRLGAAVPFAAAAATVVACGYLPYSYLAQGSAKELLLVVGVYGAIALLFEATRTGLTWRSVIPAAIAAAGVLDVYGVAALAWLGSAGVAAVVLVLLREPRHIRLRTTVGFVAGGILAAVLALPSVVSSLDFVSTNRAFIEDPNQVGNLLGPVPWSEAFNVWLAPDYRYPDPDAKTLTNIAILAVAALAVVGVMAAIRRRSYAVPVSVFAGIVGAVYVSSRYSIYFDAKSYMVLAPALGIAAAAGLLWLFQGSLRRRIAATAIGVLLGVGVLASDALVYGSAWVTPRDRFDELTTIGDRFAGQGPILVNDREDYAKYFLRRAAPWDSWGPWSPNRGLRFGLPPAPPRNPDFDDYFSNFIQRFPLLLERKRPGGSLPPSNFRVAYDTPHYRVWRREGEPVRLHAALGIGKLGGTGSLRCDSPSVRHVFDAARTEHRAVVVSYGRNSPRLSPPETWQWFSRTGPGPSRHFLEARGGFALPTPALPVGRYSVFLEGAYGPGVRLVAYGRKVGEALGDVGIYDSWQPLGDVTVGRRQPSFVVFGLSRPWWQSASHFENTNGPLAFVPIRRRTQLRLVPPRQTRTLCEKKLDWIELR
jgi:hypothetical protein